MPSYGSRKRGEVLNEADALAVSVELDGGVLVHVIQSISLPVRAVGPFLVEEPTLWRDREKKVRR